VNFVEQFSTIINLSVIFLMEENPGKLYFMKLNFIIIKTDFFFEFLKGPVFFCNFYIRVDREALVSERALDVGSVAFKAMSTKKCFSNISGGCALFLGAPLRQLDVRNILITL
jgi:hypothetical protein